MSKISDLRVVLTSFVVSLGDVTLNLLVALLTGSTVMLSQALQGLSDLITGGILYTGVRRSKQQSDDEFQFGYGREVFFWVLIAGIVMFGGTGMASVYLGYQEIISPTPIENVWLALIMLCFGITTNAYAFYLSLRRLRERGGGNGWWEHLIASSLVETKATFVIDFLGTLAATVGLISLTLFALTGVDELDGLGSIIIGSLMMIAALLLIRDVRDLIVGRSVDKQTTWQIIAAAKAVKGVNDVLDIRTMYLGSERLLVVLEVHVRDGLETDTIERLTDNVKRKVKELVPIAHHIQVEIETPKE